MERGKLSSWKRSSSISMAHPPPRVKKTDIKLLGFKDEDPFFSNLNYDFSLIRLIVGNWPVGKFYI